MSLLDQNKILNELEEKHLVFKNNNPNLTTEDFIKEEIQTGETGIMFLKWYLTSKGFDSKDASKILAKHSIKKQFGNNS